MPTNKIPSRQVIGFLIVVRLSSSISKMPALELPPFNQDQWIMVILYFIFIIGLSTPLLYLSNKFTNFSMIEYMKILYGKNIGKIIGILYGLYFIIGVVNSLTLQTELVTTSILPDSRNIVVTVVMLITCLYVASRGAVTILRGVDLLAPIIIITLFVLFFFGYNNVDFSVFLPILKDSSFLDLTKGAMMLSVQYTDIFLLTMLVSELENKKDINKIIIISLIANLIILLFAIIVTQGTLGIEYSRHSVFPFLIYTRTIDLLRVIERIDLIFVVTWVLAATSRITGFIYIATRVFRDVFDKDENDKVLVFIVSLVALVVSTSITRSRPVVGIRKDYDLYLAILYVIFVLIIPIISCIVYFIRRKSIEDVVNSDKP